MDWRDKLSVLKQEFPAGKEEAAEEESVCKKQQQGPLRVEMDKRKGKPATIVSGFEGTDEELKTLAKALKLQCSSGGSSRDGEILIQGDFREKIAGILAELGYKVKRINFPTSPTALKNRSGHQKS